MTCVCECVFVCASVPSDCNLSPHESETSGAKILPVGLMSSAEVEE